MLLPACPQVQDPLRLLGFTDPAQLDENTFWPVAFAVKALGQEEEEKVRQLLRKALGEGLEEA